jgi:hypothetical protein
MANTYSQMIQKEKRQSKIKFKLEKLESIKRMEEETKFQEKLYNAKYREEKEEQRRQEEEAQKEIESINSFLYVWAKRLTYREWLTLRDIVTNDYMQIEADIKRNKITEEQINRLKSIALLRV